MTAHATTVATQAKARSSTQRMPRNYFIPFAIETYGFFHLHFDSLLPSYAHASIAHHQQISLVALILKSCYRRQMSIAFQCAQAIVILQRAATLNHNSSFLPHISTSAPPSLAILHDQLIYKKGCHFNIRSSTSLLLF